MVRALRIQLLVVVVAALTVAWRSRPAGAQKRAGEDSAGETVVVEREVVKTVEVPGETVVVEKEVVREVEVVVEKAVTEQAAVMAMPAARLAYPARPARPGLMREGSPFPTSTRSARSS